MDLTLRRATDDDAPALGRLHHRAVCDTYPHLAWLHTEEQTVRWMAREVLGGNDVVVAVVEEQIRGYVALKPGWVEHLYIENGWRGCGIGSRLLQMALERGDELQLWTMQCNRRARDFYEHRGFRAVEFTDGADNDEHEPDVRYVRTAEG